jgi:hypothetical protein
MIHSCPCELPVTGLPNRMIDSDGSVCLAVWGSTFQHGPTRRSAALAGISVLNHECCRLMGSVCHRGHVSAVRVRLGRFLTDFFASSFPHLFSSALFDEVCVRVPQQYMSPLQERPSTFAALSNGPPIAPACVTLACTVCRTCGTCVLLSLRGSSSQVDASEDEGSAFDTYGKCFVGSHFAS